jgi:anti-sigma factor RsiW
MSQVCDTIDTLSMSYLDEELASEEKRELELHLLECTACRERVSEERQEVEMLRQRLVMPPAPDLVRAKVMRSLDREDAQVSRGLLKERVGRWLLPGTSILAAAAALMVFAFLRTPDPALPFGRVVIADHQPAALVIRGEAPTQSWVEQQIVGTRTPRFEGIDLLGGNLMSINGRTVARLAYQVRTSGPAIFELEAYLFRVQPNETDVGERVELEGRIVHVSNTNGQPAVTYVDENGIGYLFTSRDLSEKVLLELVGRSNLIDRARSVR